MVKEVHTFHRAFGNSPVANGPSALHGDRSHVPHARQSPSPARESVGCLKLYRLLTPIASSTGTRACELKHDVLIDPTPRRPHAASRPKWPHKSTARQETRRELNHEKCFVLLYFQKLESLPIELDGKAPLKQSVQEPALWSGWLKSASDWRNVSASLVRLVSRHSSPTRNPSDCTSAGAMTDGAERRHQRGREGARLTVHATPAIARSPDLLPWISECECDSERESSKQALRERHTPMKSKLQYLFYFTSHDIFVLK